MGGTRTIWRPGLATLLASALLVATAALLCSLGGCDFRREAPGRERPHELPRSITSALRSEQPGGGTPSARAPVPAPVAEALQAVHEQRLDIVPPRTAAQRLVFGVGRLLQARDGGVAFRDTKQGEVVADVSTGSVLAVAHGSDGALFALGAKVGVRLEPRATKPTEFPRATFLPGSLLFGDLEEPAHFYVYYSQEQQLYRYPFEVDGGALPPIELQSPLDGCTSALTQLRDGVFACRTASGFARKVPRGRRVDFKLAPGLGESLRLLPAKRLDELFSVSAAGEVTHLRLGPGLPVLGRFQLPASPYAAVANGEALAFVLVGPVEPGHPRAWTLLVTDFDGQARFQVTLPVQTTAADDNWLEALVADKNLAISGFEPLVAVGGSARVTAWDYAQGRQVFAR